MTIQRDKYIDYIIDSIRDWKHAKTTIILFDLLWFTTPIAILLQGT